MHPSFANKGNIFLIWRIIIIILNNIILPIPYKERLAKPINIAFAVFTMKSIKIIPKFVSNKIIKPIIK